MNKLLLFLALTCFINPQVFSKNINIKTKVSDFLDKPGAVDWYNIVYVGKALNLPGYHIKIDYEDFGGCDGPYLHLENKEINQNYFFSFKNSSETMQVIKELAQNIGNEVEFVLNYISDDPGDDINCNPNKFVKLKIK
jgi:hypothetical protein